VAAGPRPGRSRRFLPGDPRVAEPYRLTPQLAFRVAILGFLALAVFAILFLRLWALQVLSGNKYLAQANDNRVRTIDVAAPRGAILDEHGRVLVENVPGTRVELWPADLPRNKRLRRQELAALASKTGTTLAKIERGIRQNGGDPLTPVIVQYGIHQDQIDNLAEHQLEFPGVQLAHGYLRKYPNQALAAHILGYVGPITPLELKASRARKLGYQPTDVVGQAGVESTYDQYLRGHDGTAQLTVDSRGQPTSGVEPRTSPRPGSSLRLTIDLNLQRAAEHACVSGILIARTAGQTAADGCAIVAMDPKTGAIRALASYPTYQPSVYVSRDPKKLAPLQDQSVAAADNYPVLDRATSVGYPPGSTFKPVTALAAMEEHLLQPLSSLQCSPTYQVPGVTGKTGTFKNWTPYIDQPMELVQALEESCDTYFYQVGYDFYRLPASAGHPLQTWASRFGFGAPTGIDLPGEGSGLVPTPEWRRQAYSGAPYTEVDRTWKPGYSVQLAIGQGDLLVTPLQMTRFYALIANGGKLVTPHLAEDVEQPTGDPAAPHVLESFAPAPPTPTGVDATALNFVKAGLEAATHNPFGTSYGVFGHFPVDIAGKTGTAQKLEHLPGYPNAVEENQSWWCGYGPAPKPTLVVCAVIENGGEGGAAAAPAAQKVFERYFGIKQSAVITTSHPSD
jgi:penicillin-binding protein 2